AAAKCELIRSKRPSLSFELVHMGPLSTRRCVEKHPAALQEEAGRRIARRNLFEASAGACKIFRPPAGEPIRIDLHRCAVLVRDLANKPDRLVDAYRARSPYDADGVDLSPSDGRSCELHGGF